ncbi:MAG: T9SS type A sorting domain-containing protein [Candidatus Zixiibacteriota bacterium]
MPLLDTGQYLITMVAEGECGTDTCMFTVTALSNRPPVVVAGNDTTIILCELMEICEPFIASDSDNNIADITVEVNDSLGTVDGDSVCFTPDEFGTYQIVITAIDECGATDSDTISVTVNAGGAVAIICPEGVHTDTLCGPDTICIVAPITPDNAQVTVLPNGYYDPATGKVCVGIDEAGTYDVTVIAEAFCGSDTCEFTLVAEFAEPPTITCPEQVNEILCLTQPTSICYPVTITGTDVTIEVSPIGTYSNGQVCLPVDQAGTFEIDIIATNACDSDTCHTTVEVLEDQPPSLTLPSNQMYERCPDDTDLICIDGIFVSDIETLPMLTMTCGVGEFQLISLDSGKVCFLPDTFGVYEFCFEASDTCSATTGSFFVEIVERVDCDVCLKLSIDGGDQVPVGMSKNVDLLIETKTAIGGFNILLKYDVPSLNFLAATDSGTHIEDWEYFTFRDSASVGLLRLVGIADMNNGPLHPPDSALTPNGTLVSMIFRVDDDQNLGGLFLPISFLWEDCGDNSFSDPLGEDLYVDLRIFSPEDSLLWDELDDINFPESDRYDGLGVPDSCVQNGGVGKPTPIRCIEFINGGIRVIPPESLDIRGDINLNGVPYEIADAVLFTNYFIYGTSVFRINVAGQTAATDVNADGLVLSVADLVYLIRIIIGDADPYPKVVPYPDELIVSTEYDPGVVSVITDAVSDIGAALFVYNLTRNLSIDQLRLAPEAEGMDLMYGVSDGQLRILIFNIGTNKIPAGAHKLLEITYHGEGRLDFAGAEIVDYHGRPYVIAGKPTQVPSGFSLNQNYPNPFNPSTIISFDLPRSAHWTLKIYNVIGGLIREYSGTSDAGTVTVEWDGTTTEGWEVASGVYFYRLEVADYTETKKMLLLK